MSKNKITSTIFLVVASTIFVVLLFAKFFYLLHDLYIESKTIILIVCSIGTLLFGIGAFLRKENGTSAVVKSFVLCGLILFVLGLNSVFWIRSLDNLMLIQVVIGAVMTIIGLSLKKKYGVALR
jgi:hypothetical protein